MRVLLATVALFAFASVTAAAPVDYNRDIRPLLATQCYACHGPDEKTRKADLRLDVKDAAISAKQVAGKCEVSVAHGGTYPRPAAFTLDAQCRVNGEIAAPASGGGAVPQRVTHPPRSGCCSATTPPASSAATALPVLAMFVRKRRSRARAHARSRAR